MNKTSENVTIDSARGKLGVLLPGMGAVGTTFIAGVLAARRGLAHPIGSLTQLGRMRPGPDAPPSTPPMVKDALGLARLEDIVFGGWDIFEDNCYEAAKNAGVLSAEHLEPLKDELSQIRPMKAVFDHAFVRNIDGPNVKKAATKMALADALIDDIKNFMAHNGCERAVAVWCGSTEVFIEEKPVHRSLKAFEEGLKNNDDAISPTMIYAYAHIKAGVPFINGAPNRALDTPALVEMAEQYGVPFAGHDFKTGQTLMKTILAPGIAARLLGVHGWYSTNILGNRDGLVLEDPGSFKTKEESKLSVLDSIFEPEKNPRLYADMHHKVRIDYYPPRGDDKEGWDNIDIFGWMGYPMQIKVNFLCRDSILAAPLVLDLALLIDLAQRHGLKGNQTWLSFFFKSPQADPGTHPVHDLFAQQDILFDQLHQLAAQVDQAPWAGAALTAADAKSAQAKR